MAARAAIIYNNQRLCDFNEKENNVEILRLQRVVYLKYEYITREIFDLLYREGYNFARKSDLLVLCSVVSSHSESNDTTILYLE